MIENQTDTVKMIPLDRIRILNPRERNQKKFQSIIQNIANIGLKRPGAVPFRGKLQIVLDSVVVGVSAYCPIAHITMCS